MTDRVEPIGRRRNASPVERVLLTPVEREQQRREREEKRRRRPKPPTGGEGDDAPRRLDLRA